MPLEWPSDVPGPRPRKVRKAAKKARGGSGRGNGTTVGMAVAIFGSAAALFAAPFVYILVKALT
jgi:hypothetical protein